MKIYPIAKSTKTPICDEATYEAMYAESINNSDAFWAKQAKVFLDWNKDWDQTSNIDYHQGKIEWFKGGELNVAYNCIDRHLADRANQTAIIWEGDNQYLKFGPNPYSNLKTPWLVLPRMHQNH